MNLKEYEGEALFAKYGIAVPEGFVSAGLKEAERKLKQFKRKYKVRDFMLKAQVAAGKRGKAGGVLSATGRNYRRQYKALANLHLGGSGVSQILTAEKIRIKKEFYLAITVDRNLRCPVLIYSTEGGIDIEELNRKFPKYIHRLPIINDDGFPDADFKKILAKSKTPLIFRPKILETARKLWELFNEEDCLLAEINPLASDHDKKLWALDAKVVTDAEALYRHPDKNRSALRGLSTAEKKAHLCGLSYVELEGDTAVIGNGAGLVMATLDQVHAAGMRPANFCDVGGGASGQMVKEAMDVVLKKKSVKRLLINIFGGITRCDEVASGIVTFIKSKKILLPMVVRLTGTKENEALQILKQNGISAVSTFGAAIKKLRALNIQA